MSELRPNIETRDQLLKHEQELIAKARGRKTPHASSRRRPDIQTPPQNFRSEFLEKHYLNK